jgi:hypothetical protein
MAHLYRILDSLIQAQSPASGHRYGYNPQVPLPVPENAPPESSLASELLPLEHPFVDEYLGGLEEIVGFCLEQTAFHSLV